MILYLENHTHVVDTDLLNARPAPFIHNAWRRNPSPRVQRSDSRGTSSVFFLRRRTLDLGPTHAFLRRPAILFTYTVIGLHTRP